MKSLYYNNVSKAQIALNMNIIDQNFQFARLDTIIMFKFHEMTRSKLHDISKQNKSEVQKEIKPFEVQVMESISAKTSTALHSRRSCIQRPIVPMVKF
jgi:hypothetical protein